MVKFRFLVCERHAHDFSPQRSSLMAASRRVHYGWVIVGLGFLIIFACIGLGRYAYTMLLPSMQAGLGLTYDRMGYIGTGNFCGYLLAVLLAPRLIRRYRPRTAISAGIALITVSLSGIALSHGYLPPLFLYFLVGAGTGFANIPTMALVSYWFRSTQRGRAAGLMIAGNGAAIMLAGVMVPFINRTYGPSGWRVGWLILAAVALLVTLLTACFIRNHPDEMGLEPMGAALPASSDQLVPRAVHHPGALLLRLGLLYFAFGATFMVFGTFIVTTMVRDYGFSEARAGGCWSWVGFCSLFSGVIFGAVSDRIGRKYGLALVFAVQGSAYLLAGSHPGVTGLTASLLLYGSAVFAVPAIMAAAVGDYLGLNRAAASFATVTIFFAAGQTLGPSVAGIVGRATGSFDAAYLLAGAVCAAAVLLALLLPKPSHSQAD